MKLEAMAKIISILGFLSISAFQPVFALAAEPTEAAHHAPATIATLAWPAVNFLIYFSLMVHFYKKYGRPALLSRAATFDQHIKKAAQVLEDAERDLRKAEERLQTISDEQTEIHERLVHEGTQVAAQIISQAEQSALGIRGDVGRRIERELSAATSDVREQVIARATELARKKLATTLSEEDDSRLRKDAVRGLFSVNS